MSGRAGKVLISVVLLVAILGTSIVLPFPASAGQPVVTLQYTTSGQTLACSDPSCSTGAVLVSGVDTLITLYVALAGQTTSVSVFATAANCGGTVMTQLANFTISGTSAFSRIYLFYGVGFGAGSVTCGISTVGASSNVWIYADQVWSNVLQSAPIAQHAQATGTTQTLYTASVTNTPGSTDIMSDWNLVMAGTVNIPTPGTGQTNQWSKTIAAAIYGQGSTKPVTDSTPKTMYYTVSSANAAWGQYVVDIAGVPLMSASFTFTQSGYSFTFTPSAGGGVPPYTYNWTFGDTTSSSSQSPTHTYGSIGTYTVTLTVTDAGGSSVSTSQSVAVAVGGGTGGGGGSQTNLPPNTVTYPDLSRCTAVSFMDPRGSAAVSSTVLWAYNFGDGSPINYSPVPEVSHTYSVPGVYDATMTVQDKQGNVQTYGISVDTTLTGCAGAVVRGVLPPTFFGIFVALLVASFVAGKKYPKWKRRFRSGAVISFAVAIGIVILL